MKTLLETLLETPSNTSSKTPLETLLKTMSKDESLPLSLLQFIAHYIAIISSDSQMLHEEYLATIVEMLKEFDMNDSKNYIAAMREKM